MKKTSLLIIITIAVFVFTSCNDNKHPGRIYMPDMTYSRAFETYAKNSLQDSGINYLNYPVEGTIRRGDLFPYTGTNDSNGYNLSAQLKDPLPPLDSAGLNEAHRLFNINCAVCHGPNMDAQGPLAGKVGGIANLKLPQYVKLAEGTMFHVATYGKNNMGSYASQLNRKQRWMVVQYIKSEQMKGAAAAPASDSTANKKTTDTTAVKKS